MISREFLDVKTGARVTVRGCEIESSCMGPGDCGWLVHWLFLDPVNRSYCACERAKLRPELIFQNYRAIDRVLMAQIREEDSAFVINARKQYLADEIARLRAELEDDKAFGLSRVWPAADLALLRSCYRAKLNRIGLCEREFRRLSLPENSARPRLTEDQMQQAREFPITDLMDGVKPGDKILCPVHNDSTPSCSVFDDHLHCWVCGFHENSIGYLMLTRQLSFIDAVRDLIS